MLDRVQNTIQIKSWYSRLELLAFFLLEVDEDDPGGDDSGFISIPQDFQWEREADFSESKAGNAA